MPNPSSLLVAASALTIGALGALHLVLTFSGNRLHPRDAALQARMKEVSPQLTRETTMWRAWLGFNASHSLGALLFGLVYGHLALWQAPTLFGSPFLQALGLGLLVAYVVVGQRYWFSAPNRGILLATALYVAALLLHWT